MPTFPAHIRTNRQSNLGSTGQSYQNLIPDWTNFCCPGATLDPDDREWQTRKEEQGMYGQSSRAFDRRNPYFRPIKEEEAAGVPGGGTTCSSPQPQGPQDERLLLAALQQEFREDNLRMNLVNDFIQSEGQYLTNLEALHSVRRPLHSCCPPSLLPHTRNGSPRTLLLLSFPFLSCAAVPPTPAQAVHTA